MAWRGRTGWSNTVYLSPGGILEMLGPPAWVAAPRLVAPPRFAAAPRLERPVRPRRSITPRLPVPRPVVAAAATPARTTAPAREIAPDARAPGPVRTAIPAPGPQLSQQLPQAPMPEPEAKPAMPPVAEPVPQAGTASAATAGAAVVVPPVPQFTAREICVVDIAKGDTLKVRGGPGADQVLRFGFPAGVCGIKLTGTCTGGWCPIEYRNYRGWAEQKFLK